jgi:hypothetical protein
MRPAARRRKPFEAFLIEALPEFQTTIPEHGTVRDMAAQKMASEFFESLTERLRDRYPPTATAAETPPSTRQGLFARLRACLVRQPVLTVLRRAAHVTSMALRPRRPDPEPAGDQAWLHPHASLEGGAPPALE